MVNREERINDLVAMKMKLDATYINFGNELKEACFLLLDEVMRLNKQLMLIEFGNAFFTSDLSDNHN